MRKYREWRNARNRAKYARRWNWLTEEFVAQAVHQAEKKARAHMAEVRERSGHRYLTQYAARLTLDVTASTWEPPEHDDLDDGYNSIFAMG